MLAPTPHTPARRTATGPSTAPLTHRRGLSSNAITTGRNGAATRRHSAQRPGAVCQTAAAPCTVGAHRGDAATLTQRRPSELASPAWRMRPSSAITTGYLHLVTASYARRHGVQCRDVVASCTATVDRCDAVTPTRRYPARTTGWTCAATRRRGAWRPGARCRTVGHASPVSVASCGHDVLRPPSQRSLAAVRGKCGRPGSPPSHSSLHSRSSLGPQHRITLRLAIRPPGRSADVLRSLGPSDHLSPCSCLHSASADQGRPPPWCSPGSQTRHGGTATAADSASSG